MRTTARISLCALALLAAGIAGCRDDDRLSYEKDAQEGDVPPIGVQSISVLKSLYHDRTTRITQEISIQGHIVANDTAGEFYKEIVVEDDTGGIVLSIDDERLYRTCRLFDFVTINCQGLALGSEGGTLLLGTFPTGDYCVDRIPAADVARYLARQDGRISSPSTNIFALIRDDDDFAHRLEELAYTPVMRIATKHVVSVDADLPLDEACAIFASRRLKKMPVTSNGRLVGALSRRNVVHYLISNGLAARS